MESRIASLVMLGLLVAMVTARLWVEGRMRKRAGDRVEGPCDPGEIAEGWEEKGDVCEWW